MKRVLIVKGGLWDCHDPELESERFARIMREEGYETVVTADMKVLCDEKYLKECCLIIVNCTMGELPGGASQAISEAVASGVGLAGCHGGMCDAFRTDTHWQFMTGGLWVSHPGGHIEYEVNIIHGSSPITEGIEDFKVYTEQYYMHVDPAIEVLATSRVPVCKYYNAANKACDMPLAWTKYWGNGRVFYSSLGHCDSFFDEYPQAELLMRRGMVWAAEGKQYAIDNNLTTDRFDVEGY